MIQKHVLYGLLILLAACKNSPKSETQAAQPVAEAPADTRPALYLEGYYATSTLHGHEVDALFDTQTDNYWETRPGAGPDEGIMLYFQNGMPLSALQLTESGSNFDPAKAMMQVYVNGTALPPGLPGQKVNLGGQAVKSLYLRFNATGRENAVDVVNNELKTVVRTYPADASIRIRSLQLWNDKNEEVRIVAPQQIPGTVKASSVLKNAPAFSAENLFDSRKEFAWVEGNSASAGENETLHFEFEQPVHITGMQIWDGYQRSDEHFSANARVRDFTFGQPGGPLQTYTLRSTKAGQKIDLSAALSGKSFDLQVKSVYPGTSYKDLAISEILFFDGATSFVVKTGFTEKTGNSNKTAAKGSPLQPILDRRINNQTEDAEMVNQSLILRSDGTFVMYVVTEDTGDQILADGNWQLDKSDAGSATVSVFGKWFSQINLAAYYEGNTQEVATRIFRDVLTVTPETVTGTKMIGLFRIK